jgi:hypothetical protein
VLTQVPPVAAKDLCFSDILDNVFVIQKAKKLRKPGRTTPVIGYAIIPPHSGAAPMSGTAVGVGDPYVILGILIHGMSVGGFHRAASVLWNTRTGDASTHFDSDGDGTANFSVSWNPIDCKTVVIP